MDVYEIKIECGKPYVCGIQTEEYGISVYIITVVYAVAVCILPDFCGDRLHIVNGPLAVKYHIVEILTGISVVFHDFVIEEHTVGILESGY